jgi:glycerol-3-phosphate dehydrogenase
VDRNQYLQRIKEEEFDLCIIGSGASGAGAALDATLRGLKVALIEKEDFAAATSSKSTKLIHGGVRYLEQAFTKLDFGQLKQVQHGLEERYTVIKNAPFLAHPLALLTPCNSWFEGLYFAIGLKIYDWFAKGDPLPKSRWISKKEALSRAKGLNNQLHSAVLYFDGQLDDARYCMLLAKTAAESGAAVVNHIAVVAFEKKSDGELDRATLHDELSGADFSIKAKKFINCTGPAADTIRHLANSNAASRITQSKGVHAVLPLSVLDSPETALLIPKTTDGRVIFAIPWEGELLLGTTDTPYTAQDEPLLETTETDFLLENLNRYLSKPVGREAIKAGFGGIRPLIAADPNTSTKALHRDHEVEVDPDSGLISLLGGKWTTYRLMAMDVVDKVCDQLSIPQKSTTKDQLLSGAENYDPGQWTDLQQEFGLDASVCQYLTQKYGSRCTIVAQLIQAEPALVSPLVAHYPYIQAEVAYAIREEMACTIRDVLARRMRLEMTDWAATLAATPIVGQRLALELGWDPAYTQQQIETYQNKVQGFIQHATH